MERRTRSKDKKDGIFNIDPKLIAEDYNLMLTVCKNKKIKFLRQLYHEELSYESVSKNMLGF
jgi:hypothetical protein